MARVARVSLPRPTSTLSSPSTEGWIDVQVQPPFGRAPRGRSRDRGPLVLVDDLVEPRPLQSSVGLRGALDKYLCARRVDVLDDCLQPGDSFQRDGLTACAGFRDAAVLMMVDYVVRTVRNSFLSVAGGRFRTCRSRTSSIRAGPRPAVQVEERDGRGVGEARS